MLFQSSAERTAFASDEIVLEKIEFTEEEEIEMLSEFSFRSHCNKLTYKSHKNNIF